LLSPVIKEFVKEIFQNENIQIIKRPSSFILKLENEPHDLVFRIILLPPHGFTGNKFNETNPHPEVRRATITIKGGVRLGRSRFVLMKNIVKYQFYLSRDIKIKGDEPYPKVKEENYKEEVKSSGNKFFVVKENGSGFYHSLVNISDQWIVLLLEKELRLQKIPNIPSKIRSLATNEQKVILLLYKKIQEQGDLLFEQEADLVTNSCGISIDKILPALIDMLNILETGKHEACTVYAIILKIGRKNKNTIHYLKDALKDNSAPKYYLEELIKKLSK
ncbi:MAG: hypothetical protein AABX82_00570, partial [Nanoarchaeota archaeon]